MDSFQPTLDHPTAMSPRYPFPSLDDLPEDIRTRILEVQEKAGFIPNVFLAFARRPAEWRAFFAYHDALMLKEEGNLTKGDREMIVTATSAANQCLYCVVAHGAILRIYEKKPLVATRWREPPQGRHQPAPARHARLRHEGLPALARGGRRRLCRAARARLRRRGSSGTSPPSPPSSACPTDMANVTGMLPNPEFYLLGRVITDCP